jgi:membrane protein DedA with SNARE-associated domain
MNFKDWLKLLSLPLSLVALGLTYFLVWHIFNLPQGEDLMRIIQGLFDKHGLWIIFVCALAEGLLLAGNYFPGSLVIFLGVIVAGKDIPKVAGVVSVVASAFFVAVIANYLLGRYGWYKLLVKFGLKGALEDSKKKLHRHSFNAIFLSYWQPNLGAITSTAAGVLHLPPLRFLVESLVSIVAWNIFWGSLIYFLGNRALNLVNNLVYILPFAAVWILGIVLKEYIDQKRNKHGTAG